MTEAEASARLEQVKRRLDRDTEFWVRSLEVKIENEVGQVVALDPRWAQLEVQRQIDEQRARGDAVRALIHKSRKTGVSTWTKAGDVQRGTRFENQSIYTIAHDMKTARVLDSIGWRIYTSLPNDLSVKPPLRNRSQGVSFELGEKSRAMQELGVLGHNSTFEVTTAKEAESGRGDTFQRVHGSECAFWPEIATKLLAVRNAVPDDPDTEIILESTANGFNEWKKEWDRAEKGKSDYIAIFIPWWRDPMCWRRIPDEERAAFIETVGAEDPEELDLIELYGVVPEQLYWRRWAIWNKAGGDLERFKQEYPASAEEAFRATGAPVFAGVLITKTIQAARAAAEPSRGILKTSGLTVVQGRAGALEIPSGALWVPKEATGFGARHDYWRVWEHPRRKGEPDPVTGEPIEDDGAYVCSLDPADPDETTERGAAHGLQIIDWRTKKQVAELETWIDADLAGVQLHLAAMHYNAALIVVETTGGYGGSIARRLYHDVNWPSLYFRKALMGRHEKMEERLGWDTNRISKELLHDLVRQALREETAGIMSVELAQQLVTYVKRGVKTMPQPGYLADLLMSWMIGQYVASEEIPPPLGSEASGAFSMIAPRNSRTGY